MAAEDRDSGVVSLESGSVYLFYRPRVEEDEPEGGEDVQQLYLVLSPERAKRYRMLLVGQKRLPDPAAARARRAPRADDGAPTHG